MDEYITFIEKKDYESMGNVIFLDELVKYKYKGKYLIEFLLEKNYHSENMDNYLIHHSDFVPFYLKYDITWPLLNCSLKVLLTRYNNSLLFDLVLDKLTEKQKIKLYYNLRINSYNDFKLYEREVIDIYIRHGIVLPVMFISTKLTRINEIPYDDDLIKEFKELFKDTDIKLLNFIVNELKRCLLKDRNRTTKDLKKMIEFKRKNPSFVFINTNKLSGSFDFKSLELETNSNDSLMFNHELSHFLYKETEDINILEEYEVIRKKIDINSNLFKIKFFLVDMHLKFDKLKKEIENIYDQKIIEFYGSIDNYIKKIKMDMKANKPDFLLVRNKNFNQNVGYVVTDENIDDVVISFIETEKFTYSMNECRKEFSHYLMLENMLDAIFYGKIFDDIDINCISGHGGIYFCSNISHSFDECLANYDAIKKSDKGNEIIEKLRELIGNELIDFLDNYIKVNREEDSYGNR